MLDEESFWTKWEGVINTSILHTGFIELSRIHAETLSDWMIAKKTLCNSSLRHRTSLLKQKASTMLSDYRMTSSSLAPVAIEYSRRQILDRITTLFRHYKEIDVHTKETLKLDEIELVSLEKSLANLDLLKLDQYCANEFKKHCHDAEKLFEIPMLSFSLKFPFLAALMLINRTPMQDALLDLALQLYGANYEAYCRLAFCLDNKRLNPPLGYHAAEDISFLREIAQICGRTGSSSNAP